MRSDRSRRDEDERTADAALRVHFRDIAPPSLSPFFASRVRARLRADRARELDRRARWLLRMYWLGAGIAALLLVSRTAWPTSLPAGVAVAAVTFAVLATVPVMMLGRLRGGLFELILRLLP